MVSLKKGAQLILLLSVNFFYTGVTADQFTMDCGRIIDIDDYKKCTRRKFTESYIQEPSSDQLLNQFQDENDNPTNERDKLNITSNFTMVVTHSKNRVIVVHIHCF